MAEIVFAPRFSNQQQIAFDLLHSEEVRELLYGGARCGGKSWFGCVWVFERACEIIAAHNIQPSANPIPVGFIGRKQSVDFRTTTLETWKQVIPAAAYTIREQAGEIVIAGAVKIRFGGFDRSEDVQKFNSAELSFAFIDQAEEITRDDVMALRGAMRQVIGGKPVATKMLFTANPAPCWLRDEFIPDKPGSKQRFVRALPTDNPMTPPAYLDQLKLAYKHRPELLRAMIDGDWFAFGGTSQVIRDADIMTAKEIILRPTASFVLLACDPARFGDDQTVIYELHNTQVVRQEIYGGRDTTYTAMRLQQMSLEAGGCPVAIDATGGIGGSVAGQLMASGVDVIEFDFGGRSSEPTKYANVRAEIWWRAGEMFAGKEIMLRDGRDWAMSESLKQDLTAPNYEFMAGDGKIKIEDKARIKERLGRSPDEGDAYVVGIAGYEYLSKHRYVTADGVRFRPGKRVDPRVSLPPHKMAQAIVAADMRTSREEAGRWS